jgi:succinoglycan biosynthesis transport protein ExoP
MEEEIDLGEYINVIVRRWKWVLGITLVAVAAAAIVSFFLLTPVYEAEAGVVIVKSRSEVVFEPKYRTLTEEELGNLGIDIKARRQALEALVKSSLVAAEVIAKLGSMLEPEEQDVNVLLEKVMTESTGDLIGIKVTGGNPGKIVAIADAWGEAYEEYVNELYGGRTQSPASIQAQVAEARDSYQQTEEALIEFLGDNRVDELNREIQAIQTLIADYRDAQTKAQTAAFNQQLETKRQVLANYYADLIQLEQLLADARALHKQLQGNVASPSAATGDALAVMFLRTQAFASSARVPVELQMPLEQVAVGTAGQQAEDVKALIAVLETRRDETQAHIDSLSSQLLVSVEYELTAAADDPINRLIAQYSQGVLELQEQLEREEARKRELTSARDLAWETYDTLARKEAEVGVASQVTDTEVRFAVPAVEPKKPVSPRKKLNIAIAGALGLMVGVFATFTMEYFQAGGQRPE